MLMPSLESSESPIHPDPISIHTVWMECYRFPTWEKAMWGVLFRSQGKRKQASGCLVGAWVLSYFRMSIPTEGTQFLRKGKNLSFNSHFLSYGYKYFTLCQLLSLVLTSLFINVFLQLDKTSVWIRSDHWSDDIYIYIYLDRSANQTSNVGMQQKL